MCPYLGDAANLYWHLNSKNLSSAQGKHALYFSFQEKQTSISYRFALPLFLNPFLLPLLDVYWHNMALFNVNRLLESTGETHIML